MLSCDLPSFARAGRVLRPHPAMLAAPVQPTHYLGGSRSDLGLKAAGARPARTRSAEQVQVKLPVVAAPRRPRPPARRRKRACEQQGRNACAPMESSSTAVAHRDGRLHQRPGGTPMQARVPNSFVPTSGAIGAGHGGDSLAACCALTAERPFCTWLATHARAAGTCRAVQARDS